MTAALTAWALLGTTACAEQRRPWEGVPDGAVVDESRPFLPAGRDAGSAWLGDAGLGLAADEDGTAGPPETAYAHAPSPAGGMWTSCQVGFAPTGSPRRDVERLGLMCGPVNGMVRHGDTWQGEVDAEAREHAFAVRAGECYRVFAVADATVGDLDVEVRSGRGSRLGGDDGKEPVAIVDAQGPFCSFHDDRFLVRVVARRGRGHHATQIWRLPARETR